MDLTNIIAGKWKQLSGNVQKTWGKLTDDEITEINGNKDVLVGKLQEKYGWTKDEAEKNVSDFFDKAEDVKDDLKDKAEDVKDDAEGLWDKMVAKVKDVWDDFTDEDLKEINKDKDALLDKIATKYKITKEEAKAKIEDIM